jgi:hypothetical protein
MENDGIDEGGSGTQTRPSAAGELGRDIHHHLLTIFFNPFLPPSSQRCRGDPPANDWSNGLSSFYEPNVHTSKI